MGSLFLSIAPPVCSYLLLELMHSDACVHFYLVITSRVSTNQQCSLSYTRSSRHIHVDTSGSMPRWCCTYMQGASFETITGMTDKFEGCVVREMRRLDELMKNLHLAAKVRHTSPHPESVCPVLLRIAVSLWLVLSTGLWSDHACLGWGVGACRSLVMRT